MSKTDLIPAERAEIFFNSKVGKAPHELLVVDRQTRFRDGVIDARNLIEGYDQYLASLGAHCAGWLTEDGPTNTPEGIFAIDWIETNPKKESFVLALREFAKIDRCEWARLMLRAIEAYNRDDENESMRD